MGISSRHEPASAGQFPTPPLQRHPAAAREQAMRRRTIAPLFLVTGVSLLVYILGGISLGVALAAGVVFVAALGIWRWRHLDAGARAHVARRVRVGLLAGLPATAAYDLCRYLIIKVLHFTFWPFDIFSLFGQALIGAPVSGPLVTAAGVAFHVANGVCFATFYAVAFGRAGIRGGIAWAFCLEALMVSVYPGWLGLKALDEFLQVSILGHAAYGSVLGFVSRRLLANEEG